MLIYILGWFALILFGGLSVSEILNFIIEYHNFKNWMKVVGWILSATSLIGFFLLMLNLFQLGELLQ